MEDVILRFDKLSVEYNGAKVLSDFSCEVKRGEFVSLIGPNGSGKTTIINTLLRIVSPTSGSITLAGKDNREYSAKERSRIAAVVPQTFSTTFGFSVKDIVRMGRNPYLRRFQSESEEDMRIVDEALRYTDVFAFRDRKITSLSGGERQRVVIAGALAQTPQLLVLDEPTNHLDLNHTLEIMALLSELNKTRGMTVFAVLHDINMASRYSDRLVLLNKGSIVCEGTAQEVLTEETLGPVYGIDLVSRKNRLTDSVEIVPIRKRPSETTTRQQSVHVVCGGGSGEMYLGELKNQGYPVRAGVVNISDSDADACFALGIPAVLEDPYTMVGDAAHAHNIALMAECQVIILTEVPFGCGNLNNLKAVEQFSADPEKRIYVVKAEDRDFTGGEASEIIARILQCPGVIETTGDELMDTIRKGEL